MARKCFCAVGIQAASSPEASFPIKSRCCYQGTRIQELVSEIQKQHQKSSISSSLLRSGCLIRSASLALDRPGKPDSLPILGFVRHDARPCELWAIVTAALAATVTYWRGFVARSQARRRFAATIRPRLAHPSTVKLENRNLAHSVHRCAKQRRRSGRQRNRDRRAPSRASAVAEQCDLERLGCSADAVQPISYPRDRHRRRRRLLTMSYQLFWYSG